MGTEEIQLSNGEIFKIVDSSVPITRELIMSVADTLEASKNVKILAWTPVSGSDRSCIVTAQCVPPHGYITMAACPTLIAAGAPFTISITATNDSSPPVTGNYIIGITTSPVCTVTAFPSGGSTTQSPVLTLTAGATSASQSWTFTMKSPAVPISVVANLSSDCP